MGGCRKRHSCTCLSYIELIPQFVDKFKSTGVAVQSREYTDSSRNFLGLQEFSPIQFFGHISCQDRNRLWGRQTANRCFRVVASSIDSGIDSRAANFDGRPLRGLQARPTDYSTIPQELRLREPDAGCLQPPWILRERPLARPGRARVAVIGKRLACTRLD